MYIASSKGFYRFCSKTALVSIRRKILLTNLIFSNVKNLIKYSMAAPLIMVLKSLNVSNCFGFYPIPLIKMQIPLTLSIRPDRLRQTV